MKFYDQVFSDWVLTFLLIFIVYSLLTKNFNYFHKYGIPYVKPYPLFGNVFRTTVCLENWATVYQRFYDAFPKDRFFGIFEFTKPVLVIRDPELIKQISVKDFDHFMNHRNRIEKSVDPMWGRNLFMMRDQEWKKMRSTLSPMFTGSKMRMLFQWINDCAKNTCDDLKMKTVNGPIMNCDCKELFKRYAADVIANCIFGLDVNCVTDRDNEFYQKGNRVANVEGGITGFKFSCYILIPKLMTFLKARIFDENLISFFRSIVMSTIKNRESSNFTRKDMIDLLLQTRKGLIKDDETGEQDAGFATVTESSHLKTYTEKYVNWEDDDLTAQCFVFFLAGFDTVNTHLGFVAYELAVNQDVQDKLIEEVDQALEELDGKQITYDVLQNMKYLDMVVCEALRKWPPVSLLNRECNKTTTLTNSDGKLFTLQLGDPVWFPVHSIQNDPKHFSNPEKFDPTRFSPQNRKNIDPFTFMPFGQGPRSCIASRFALIESKVIIFNMLQVVRFEVGSETDVPLKLKKDSFFLRPEKNVTFKLAPRSI